MRVHMAGPRPVVIARRVAVALAAVTVAACSSSTSGSPSSTTPASAGPSAAAPVAAGAGPCAYIPASAAKQFGDHTTFPGTRQQELDFGPSCDYGSAVFTLVTPDVSAASFTYGTTRTIPGIGDHAYYGAEYHWLRVAKGRVRFEIRCRLCSGNEVATMSAVAKTVVARIP